MRILHVVRGLNNSSGTTHIVVPLAEEQARRGCSVAVYFVAKGGEQPIAPDAALVESRCFAQSLPGSNPGISLELARAMQADVGRFDIVHIHAVWNFPTYWAMRAALKAGVPYVVAPQGSFEPWALRQSGLKKRVYGHLTEVPLLNRAAALQALSENEARQFRAFGLTAPTVIVPNGIEPAKFGHPAPRLAERLGLGPGVRTLLFLSRLHPKKGVDVLLKAFAFAGGAIEDVVLVIAGHDGGSGYGASMRRLAEELGIAPRCRFVGELRDEQKCDVLAGADAFILPSHSEGLPIAVLEAMASGLPVIITPGCNLPEVETDGAGLVVASESGEMAKAIASVLGAPEFARRMGKNGQCLVRKKFTWREIAQRLLDLYDAVGVSLHGGFGEHQRGAPQDRS